MGIPGPQMSRAFRTCDDPHLRDGEGDGGPERRRCVPQTSPKQVSEAPDGNLGRQALDLKHTLSSETIHSFIHSFSFQQRLH